MKKEKSLSASDIGVKSTIEAVDSEGNVVTHSGQIRTEQAGGGAVKEAGLIHLVNSIISGYGESPNPINRMYAYFGKSPQWQGVASPPKFDSTIDPLSSGEQTLPILFDSPSPSQTGISASVKGMRARADFNSDHITTSTEITEYYIVPSGSSPDGAHFIIALENSITIAGGTTYNIIIDLYLKNCDDCEE